MASLRGKTETPILDSDVHHTFNGLQEVAGYLPAVWREYIGFKADLSRNTNSLYRMPASGFISSGGDRLDAIPPGGGTPGSDPEFMVKHHLDRWDIDFVVLSPGTTLGLGGIPIVDFAAQLATAVNQWTYERWLPVDERYLAAILVGPRDPIQAAAEIRRCAALSPRFVQVTMNYLPTLMGNRFLHPIYDAANEVGLPVNLHVGGAHNGVNPGNSGAGFETTFYELHIAMTIPGINHLLSLVSEGVFEKFPNIRWSFNEFGVAWLPYLMWRMDMEYKSNRRDVPWLKRLPSEYVKQFVRFSTQPLEFPGEDPKKLATLLSLVDAEDMLMFASDYPHWDFDSPDYVIKHLPEEWRARILFDTAREFYQLDRRVPDAPSLRGREPARA
jgi:predicted TIM-barrel fold metal-dependent hydrolase